MQKNKYILIDGAKKGWGKKKIHIVLPGSEIHNNREEYTRTNDTGNYISWCRINAEGKVVQASEVDDDEIEERLCSKCRQAAIQDSNNRTPTFIKQ